MSLDTRAARERAEDWRWSDGWPGFRSNVVALCDEVDSLRAENHDLRGQLSARDAADFVDDEIAQNADGRYRTAVRDEVDRLRAALSFYANVDAVTNGCDGGERARVALGEQT